MSIPPWQGPPCAVRAEAIQATPWWAWLCTLCGGDGSPVPPSPPQARASWLGDGEEEAKGFFPSPCYCPAVACDVFLLCEVRGLCPMSAGTRGAGCRHTLAPGLHPSASVMSSPWDMRLWCRTWSMAGMIYGKRNRTLSYILANMVNFYIQWCSLPWYAVAGSANTYLTLTFG